MFEKYYQENHRCCNQRLFIRCPSIFHILSGLFLFRSLAIYLGIIPYNIFHIPIFLFFTRVYKKQKEK
jgi:hypothetical protein